MAASSKKQKKKLSAVIISFCEDFNGIGMVEESYRVERHRTRIRNVSKQSVSPHRQQAF